jgi:hypothetical protein
LRKSWDSKSGPVATSHPLAIQPLRSLQFHEPTILLGAIPIIISGVADRLTALTGGCSFPAIKSTQHPPVVLRKASCSLENCNAKMMEPGGRSRDEVRGFHAIRSGRGGIAAV